MRRNKTLSISETGPEFYDYAPSISLNRSMLLELSTKRLDLLKFIEDSRLKNSGNKEEHFNNGADIEAKFTEFNSFLAAQSKLLKIDEKSLDSASNFMLKLLCCDDESNKEWFVANETKLFELNLTSKKIENFFKKNENFEKISLEKNDLKLKNILEKKLKIYDPSGNTSLEEMLKIGVYPIHFVAAPNLLTAAPRSYLPENGYFYLCGNELQGIVVAIFKDKMTEQLQKMAENRAFLLKDPRISSVIQNLSSKKLFDFAVESGMNYSRVTPEEFINMRLKKELPPCAMRLMRTFESRSHLKNNGRYQFSSLCKSLSFTEQEALRMVDRYDKSDSQKIKEFKYNVSHHYGSVGSGVGGKSCGCKRVMELANKDGLDYPIGCPFVNNLEGVSNELKSLYGSKLATPDIEDIMSQESYVERCHRLFEILHGPAELGSIVTSPQRWIRAASSRRNKE